jgi:hypothetical protein
VWQVFTLTKSATRKQRFGISEKSNTRTTTTFERQLSGISGQFRSKASPDVVRIIDHDQSNSLFPIGYGFPLFMPGVKVP